MPKGAVSPWEAPSGELRTELLPMGRTPAGEVPIEGSPMEGRDLGWAAAETTCAELPRAPFPSPCAAGGRRESLKMVGKMFLRFCFSLSCSDFISNKCN